MGVSPKGSHRTVREPLDSYGSYYSAIKESFQEPNEETIWALFLQVF